MNKTLKDLIVRKTGWKAKEAELAYDELLRSDSFLYTDHFLEICATSNDPSERWGNLVDYLLSSISDDPIDLISKIIFVDPCFKMLAFFNIYDYSAKYINDYTVKINNNDWKDIEYLYFNNKKKSLINWELIYLTEDINYNISLVNDISTDPELLTYKFSDILIRKYTNIEDDLLKPNSIIISLIERIGLIALSFESIRNLINKMTLYPGFPENRKRLKRLKSVIYVSYASFTEITNRKHWLLYVFVEELRKKGFGLLASFREASKILGEVRSTIERRYFEKKKELRSNKINLDDIIVKYNLMPELNEYLNKMEKLEELIKYLEDQKPGENVDNRKLESLLSECWNEIDSSARTGMEGDKIFGRTENMSWEPPILRFSIERHGGTVLGSTRAEIQHWEFNIEDKLAQCVRSGHRQLRPMQPRLDIKNLAREIADLIINREEDERLNWVDETNVRVLIGNIIPSERLFKQTLSNRRKRFREELGKILAEQGWREVRANLFTLDQNYLQP